MLTAKDSVLVVIDVQGKLAEAMCDRAELFENICRLAKSAKLLAIPILVTEQLPDKLGSTRKEIADPLAEAPFITKSSFSCCGEPKFTEALKSSGKNQIVLCFKMPDSLSVGIIGKFFLIPLLSKDRFKEKIPLFLFHLQRSKKIKCFV
jgi:isochorismate hydrolase